MKMENCLKMNSSEKTKLYTNSKLMKMEKRLRIFREDGTLNQLQTYENGEDTKTEFFREDETLEIIQTFENGEKTKTDLL